jgi:D-beta-D-heptose 7-phosphate kinase/D-beta-D-heptose 1-phosphate adenosyltransferase
MTMTTHPKILSLDELAAKSRALRAAGRQLVFTNGCFDLLHVGHVRYLAAARREGDALAVGLNSDASVLRIKGPRRPIVPERERAEVLAALACVDFVTVFDEPDPLRVILAVQPAVLVKGGDCRKTPSSAPPRCGGAAAASCACRSSRGRGRAASSTGSSSAIADQRRRGP